MAEAAEIAALLSTQGDAVLVPVHAVARSQKTRVLGLHGGALKVAVAAPPVEGAANQELCAGLAKLLGLPKRAVSVHKGEHGRQKRIRVEGLTALEIARLLAAASRD